MPSGADYQNNPRVEGGQVEVFTVANPAAAAGWTFTIPATEGYSYEIKGIAYRLVTDANVAARTNFQLTVDDGTTELGRSFSSVTCSASKTFQFSANVGFQGGSAGINDVMAQHSLPLGEGTRLLPGWRITMPALSLMQAGDQISNIRIVAIRRPFPN